MAEDLAQTVKGGIKRLECPVPVGLGPEHVAQLVLADPLALPKRSENLEHFQGLLLSLLGKFKRLSIDNHFKPAQSKYPYGPGPVIQMHRRLFRNQVSFSDDVLHIANLYLFLQCFDAQFCCLRRYI